MDEDTFSLAVETTAQLEVMRNAIAFLMARSLIAMPRAQADRALEGLAATLGDLPALQGPASLEARRFHKGVAGRMPEVAEDLVAMVGAVVEDLRRPALVVPERDRLAGR